MKQLARLLPFFENESGALTVNSRAHFLGYRCLRWFTEPKRIIASIGSDGLSRTIRATTPVQSGALKRRRELFVGTMLTEEKLFEPPTSLRRIEVCMPRDVVSFDDNGRIQLGPTTVLE